LISLCCEPSQSMGGCDQISVAQGDTALKSGKCIEESAKKKPRLGRERGCLGKTVLARPDTARMIAPPAPTRPGVSGSFCGSGGKARFGREIDHTPPLPRL